MIIKLYDNEDYAYPMIRIKDYDFEQFMKDLKEYQTNEEYNIDDFIMLLETKPYFIETLTFNKEVFF